MPDGTERGPDPAANAPGAGHERASRDYVRGALDVGFALLLFVVSAVAWTRGLSDAHAWGWDESMHAALPAARMAVALGQGEFGAFFDALHSCAQYPFVWPLVLGAVQLVTGVSEHAGRVAGTLAWCFTLVGLFFVAGDVVRALAERRGAAPRDHQVPVLAFSFGALCPLALAFSGTYFLEVPAACAIVWALHAWLARARHAGTSRERRAELLAGAGLALAFFTKFNYGLMFALALGLDWTCELAGAVRSGRGAAFAKRSAWLVPVPALALLWWFVLPLPLGSETAAEHRHAFAAFLGGNQGFARSPDLVRLAYLGDWFAFTPRLFVLELVLALAALRWVRVAAVRVLLFLLLTTAVPIALHPFHDPRFQILIGPALWLLAALGLRSFPRWGWPVNLELALPFVVAVVAASWDREGLARWTGVLRDDDPHREYVRARIEALSALGGDRPLPTGGLERSAHDALAATVAGEVGPGERVGWIGMSSEFSPGALHLALLQRGGPPERFLVESARTLDVDYFGDGSGVTDEALKAYLAGFDVVLTTDPPDLKGRKARAGFAGYRERLAALGWGARAIGTVSVARPPSAPLDVTVYACRPNR